MSRLLIYGATGYTGRMVAARAKAIGLDVVVAGRDGDKLGALSRELDVDSRIFALDVPNEVDVQLSGFAAVLNCAGPFVRTAEPLMRSCIAMGMHYLDITAEINVYRLAETLSESARDAGSMLMPGVGWDVVPTDCLALHVAQRVLQPRILRIALQVGGSMSRGSAISANEIIAAGLLARVNGKLVARPTAGTRRFDFGDGAVDCFPLSFGDLVTAWQSTRIPNIEMFVHISDEAFPQGDLSDLPEGPSAEQREAHRAKAVAEVTSADGGIARSMIDTINGYDYTPMAAAAAAHQLIIGRQGRPGFQTPASVFGVKFAEGIADTRIVDF
eukprot:TRINITY_DN40342_c0_g1_i6.p1 TRINITY_DN40342_c0_g1~~TRINITY_DN40342_c0_g1_i6.p1  ORF type:complete len:329 (-),score=71.65 TRINITY_DN40342_c0_g1_i6:328-1314(-)